MSGGPAAGASTDAATAGDRRPDVPAARMLSAGRAMEGERKPAGYAFKHDLTQGVAYWSELSERRARLHGAVGRPLEEAGRSAPATPG